MLAELLLRSSGGTCLGWVGRVELAPPVSRCWKSKGTCSLQRKSAVPLRQIVPCHVGTADTALDQQGTDGLVEMSSSVSETSIEESAHDDQNECCE